MPTEKNEAILIRWALQTQNVLGAYNAAFSHFNLSAVKLDGDTEALITRLGINCTITSDSALYLVAKQKFWDADILLRTVAEGTCKFLYVLVGNHEDQKQRAAEYLEIMPEIARLRRHRRAQTFLGMVADADSPRWKPIRDVLLESSEEDALYEKYPSAIRADLEQRWSFAGLLKELANAKTLSGAEGLLYEYGMGSHQVHQDGDAFLVIAERERRGPERIAAIELAHGGGILRTLIAYSRLRVTAAFVSKGLDPQPILAVVQAAESLESEFESASQQFRNIEYGEPARP